MTSEGARSGISHFFLNALRIATGLLFFQHGLPKMFGILGRDAPAEFPTIFWWAGVLEVFGGTMIALGLLTRPVAFVLAGEMAVAYFYAHFTRGFWPVVNGGELAALYCFVYLFLAANGGGSFSVDGLIDARSRGSAAG